MIYDPADPDCSNEELQNEFVPGSLIQRVFGNASLIINADYVK
jgi:hypothetical protein